MSIEQPIAAYEQRRLGGRPIPPDLRILLARAWSGDDEGDPLTRLGVSFFAPEQSIDLLDHSYLTERDRANPDIMANVAAIDAVNRLIIYVAQDDETNIYGYWLGPEDLPIDQAPIVRFDTEGQYLLLSGRTLTEALLVHLLDGDDFAQARDELAAYGISIANLESLETPAYSIDPSDLHRKRYNEERVRAGLPPVKL